MNDTSDIGGEPDVPPVVVHHRLPWALAVLIVVPLLIITLYLAVVLHLDYSNGSRAGILQKFSEKGWVCKTWEGELAMTTVPGVAPTLWSFSIRDRHAAEQVGAMVGRHVLLHYTEHRGVPTSCFGETQYYVDSVAVIP
jgi:hypothetical protein